LQSVSGDGKFTLVILVSFCADHYGSTLLTCQHKLSINVQQTAKALNMDNQEKTINLIREAMKDRNLSSVSRGCRLSRNTIQAVVDGRYSSHPATIKVLADYLGVAS
jgi:hypothetical protein